MQAQLTGEKLDGVAGLVHGCWCRRSSRARAMDRQERTKTRLGYLFEIGGAK